MRPHVTAVLGLLAAVALTGCDTLDAALGDTDGDGSSDPRPLAYAEVRGGPEDWLGAVCGRDATITSEEPYNSEYTATRTAQLVCTVDGDDVGDRDVEEYEVVAAVYSTNPSRDLVNESDSYKSGDGNELAWAFGSTREGWAVVWLYPDSGVADPAVLEPLAERGFDVDQLDYGG